MLKRILLSIALLGTLAAYGTARADDDLDRLRDAVRRGDVLPLSALQLRLRERFPGEIIDVELDEDDGRFIYEFRVLQVDGRLLDVEMDARNGHVLEVDDDD